MNVHIRRLVLPPGSTVRSLAFRRALEAELARLEEAGNTAAQPRGIAARAARAIVAQVRQAQPEDDDGGSSHEAEL